MNENAERQPVVLGWEITNSCNLHCPHCYNPEVRPARPEFTTDECKRVIDSAAALGTRVIGWTGGEPLLRQDLEELVAYAFGKHGIRSGITTNGVLLDHERGERLKAAQVGTVQVSLDGSTPQRSWRIRRTTDEEFSRVIEAIRVCRELELDVCLAMLLGLENLDDGYEMVKLARREGVAGIRFCGFTPEGRGRNDTMRRRFQFGEQLPRLHRFIEEVSGDDSLLTMFDPGFGPVPPDYSFHECVAGMQTCYVRSSGDVFPCTAMLGDRFRVGNLRERPLRELWNDPAMSVMSRFDHNRVEGVCAVCDNADNCHGACRSLTYAHTGSFEESFPHCLYRVGSAETHGKTG